MKKTLQNLQSAIGNRKSINAPWSISGLWIPRLGLPAFLLRLCTRHSGGFQGLRNPSSELRPPTSVRIANDSQVGKLEVEGAATEFEVLQGDWVQLAPYGQFPHSRGMQYFDHTDAERLVERFTSLMGKLMRRWGGLPWYEGHPDTSPKDYPNKRAYGWIDQVQARNDGFYGHVKWTNAGRELIAEGHYKYFSPVWDAVPARVGGKPVFRPVELISVGFTNTPNMPVLPLSNEEEAPAEETQDDEAMTYHPEILKTLGFPEGATPTDEEVVAAWAKHTEEFQTAVTAANAAAEQQTAFANEKSGLETSLENERKAVKNLGEQLEQTSKAYDEERHERIELVVANAIASGKITKADADKWRTDLKEDFAGKSVELANSKPVIKTNAITGNLGEEQNKIETGSTPSEQVRALANEKMAKGMSFDAAWQQVKKERPDLIAGMQQPKTA